MQQSIQRRRLARNLDSWLVGSHLGPIAAAWVVALFVSPLLLSPAFAQVSYELTPLEPVVLAVTHGAIGAPFFSEIHSLSPGKVALNVTTVNNVVGNGAISAEGPNALIGTLDAAKSTLRLSPAARFTVNQTINNAKQPTITVFTTNGYQQEDTASLTLTLDTITVTRDSNEALLSVWVDFRLPISSVSQINHSYIRYSIQFRWRLSGAQYDIGQPAPTAAPPAPQATDTNFLAEPSAISNVFGGKCLFRDSGQLTFDIPVNRVVGQINTEIKTDFSLIDPEAMINNGVLSKTAKLRLAVWDVDSDPRAGPVPPERDVIRLNGYDIGNLAAPAQPSGSGTPAVLTGFDKQWRINEFEVPIGIIRFGARGNPGPHSGLNTVTLDVDRLATGTPVPDKENWCTSVAWASISFDAMAPLMLVHGTNAQHDSWEAPIQGMSFVDRLRELHIPFDHFIDLDPNGQAELNAVQLDGILRQKAADFGVKHLHIIAHSKGGTDSRMLLWSPKYTPNAPDGYTVLSLFAMGTPSKGTILSDLSAATLQANITKTTYIDVPVFGKVPVKLPDLEATKNDIDLLNALKDAAAVDFLSRKKFQYSLGGIPGLLTNLGSSGVGPGPDIVGSLAPASFALIQQTLEGMRKFNAKVKKAPGVCYYSIAGNADRNGNTQIDPTEAEGFFPGDDKLNAALISLLATNTYRNLGLYSSVDVVEEQGPNGIRKYITATVVSTDLKQLVPNDMVSPEPSVHCAECGFIKLSTTGNNHSSLKRKEIADFVLNKINTGFPLGKQALPCAP